MPLSAVMLALAAVTVLSMVVLGVLAAHLARRVLAGLGRAQDRLGSVRTDAALQVRARALPPGFRREVAGMRVRLRDSARATAATATLQAPRPLVDLAADIDRSTRGVDTRLAGLLREPDLATASADLPRLRREVSEICAAGADLRAALRHTTAPHAALDETAALARQAAAVRQALDELHHSDPAPPVASHRSWHDEVPAGGSTSRGR
jgi:hypothetical protein